SPAGLARIHPLLPGPGPLSGGRRRLGEMEQAPHPPVEADAGGGRQLQGAARSGDQHLHVVARARTQLPFPADLRTLGTAKMNRLSGPGVAGCSTSRLPGGTSCATPRHNPVGGSRGSNSESNRGFRSSPPTAQVRPGRGDLLSRPALVRWTTIMRLLILAAV